MKQILIAIAFCTFLAGCATKANKQARKENPEINLMIPDTLKTSTSFKIFCNEMAEDQQKQSKSGVYIPSEYIQNKYSLLEKDGVYYIRGYMYITELFDKNALQSLGGSNTEYTDKIQSFSIPLDQLSKMLLLPGITYLELAQKVKLIKH